MPSHEASLSVATAVLDRLPPSGAPYTDHYQPVYLDEEALVRAIYEVGETTPVTNFHQVNALQRGLTNIATGESNEAAVTTGGCNEPVDARVSIPTVASRLIADRAIAMTAPARPVLHISRSQGQSTKPRSAAEELLEDGRRVPPYMGDAVNGRNPQDRTPDPSR